MLPRLYFQKQRDIPLTSVTRTILCGKSVMAAKRLQNMVNDL